MSLVPRPTATITDADVADVLGQAVWVINPALDVLSGPDPLGLKEHNHRLGDARNAGDKVRDALACLLNTADVPGTQAWDRMDSAHRINWWVRRVGALDTVLVAFPGFFGAAADRLPIQDLLGFVNQAIVLCAVARELDITDRAQQVRLLAAVLCDRDLTAHAEPPEDAEPPEVSEDTSLEQTGETTFAPFALAKTLWHLAGIMRAISDELGKRPQPKRILRYLGMLPVVGAIAGYFGEYGALVRAAKAGQDWIALHATPNTTGRPS